jgi:hypothetical protein
MIVEDDAAEPGLAALVGDAVDDEMIARQRRPDRQQQPGREPDRLGIDLGRRRFGLGGPECAESLLVDRSQAVSARSARRI